jgi:hypothetical protein
MTVGHAQAAISWLSRPVPSPLALFQRLTRGIRSGAAFFGAIYLADVLGTSTLIALSAAIGERRGLATFLGNVPPVSLALVGIFVAPLLESAMLLLAVVLVKRISRSADMALLLAPAIMGPLYHGSGAVFNSLAAYWPFLLQSAVLLCGRYGGQGPAFVAVVGLHAAHNATVAALVLTALAFK